MTTTDPGLYARSFADVYDDWYRELHDTAAIRSAVAARVGQNAVVAELGSGSGHIAAALVDDGHTVLAVDSSAAMLGHDNSGSHRIVADMAASAVRSDVADIAIIAWNTLFTVTPTLHQHSAMAEAARILKPTGWLVIEGFVAHPNEDGSGLSVRSHHARDDAHLIIVTHQQPGPNGLLAGVHVEVLPEGTVARPWQLAYQTPTEIDASARAASLQLAERHGDWGAQPFRSDGDRHVSWYRAI